ncbi:MAG TPA: hypothetical protein VMI73_01860 [Trebonia sp.]|nr:hypothetical protein [Trebonia sp.]
MSQRTARHDPRAKSGDEDVDEIQARHPERRQGVRPRQPVSQPAGDDGVSPDEPDEGEFEVVGDDDLSDVDLGPAAPNFTDPDAPSGRMRKITPESERGSVDSPDASR